MGYKNVCLNCKRIESLGTDCNRFRTGACPKCSTEMHFVSQKFRPPKASDRKSWDVVAYMISHGFCYQTIRDDNGMAVAYPTTMLDAKDFVMRFKSNDAFQNARTIHAIEKQIVELEARDQNRDRDDLIRQLKSKLDSLSPNAG